MKEKIRKIDEKLFRALMLLLFKRGMKAGARADELKKALGKDYNEILKIFNEELKKIGLEIKAVSLSNEEFKETPEKLRYVVRTIKSVKNRDVKLIGWDKRYLAALAIITSYLASRDGKASEQEIVKLLREKEISQRKIDAFVKAGYLKREGEVISFNWRAKAEVDQELLKRLLLGKRIEEK